jgi:hypothetical protein
LPRTGGRQKGTPNRVTREREGEIAASGLTPLEWMLTVLRDTSQPFERRDDMAKAAAPYVHPRLSSVEANHRGTLDLRKFLMDSE